MRVNKKDELIRLAAGPLELLIAPSLGGSIARFDYRVEAGKLSISVGQRACLIRFSTLQAFRSCLTAIASGTAAFGSVAGMSPSQGISKVIRARCMAMAGWRNGSLFLFQNGTAAFDSRMRRATGPGPMKRIKISSLMRGA
jgi:hypothetical protein